MSDDPRCDKCPNIGKPCTQQCPKDSYFSKVTTALNATMARKSCAECCNDLSKCDCPAGVTYTQDKPVPTIENRLEGLDAQLKRASEILSSRIRIDAPRIAAMMQRRVLNQGASEYPNDPVFNKTEAQLEQDVFEELADALFYEAVRLKQKDSA